MSEDLLAELVDKVVNDNGFRESAMKDLNGTLAKHGYTSRLTKEELSAVREFHAQVRGLSPEELNRRLTSNLGDRKQGSI